MVIRHLRLTPLGSIRPGLRSEPLRPNAALCFFHIPTQSERLGLEPEEVQTIRNWQETFRLEDIPSKGIEYSFHRSSGPGGQNVNKVNTKVDMRFKLAKAMWIPDFVKRQLRQQETNRLNQQGEFIVTSERHRTQRKNIEDCRQKLWEMVRQAAYIPPDPAEEAIDRLQKRHELSKENLKKQKMRRSGVKQNRRGGRGDD